MKNICRIGIGRDHGNELEGGLRPHEKWFSGKAGKIPLQASERFRKLLLLYGHDISNTQQGEYVPGQYSFDAKLRDIGQIRTRNTVCLKRRHFEISEMDHCVYQL